MEGNALASLNHLLPAGLQARLSQVVNAICFLVETKPFWYMQEDELTLSEWELLIFVLSQDKKVLKEALGEKMSLDFARVTLPHAFWGRWWEKAYVCFQPRPEGEFLRRPTDWLEQTLLYPTPLEMGHTFTICDQAVHWNHACPNPFGWGISNVLCLLSLFCFLSQASVFTHCLGCLFSGFTEHFPPRLMRLEETRPCPGE